MAEFRVATMNVENLFHRFRFDRFTGVKEYVNLSETRSDLSPTELAETYFNALNQEQREFTALTIDEYRQLDYLLASPNLFVKNRETTPRIVREGMPYRARASEGDRWARIGHARPKASDHCAVAATLTL